MFAEMCRKHLMLDCMYWSYACVVGGGCYIRAYTLTPPLQGGVIVELTGSIGSQCHELCS